MFEMPDMLQLAVNTGMIWPQINADTHRLNNTKEAAIVQEIFPMPLTCLCLIRAHLCLSAADYFILGCSEPLNKSMDSLFDLGLRVIAKEAPGLLDIGKCLRDITRLGGLTINYSMAVEFFFQKANQLA